MPVDWNKLLTAMVPLGVGLANPQGGGASFVHGFQSADQMMWKRRIDEEEAARRDAATRAEMANRDADNKRLDQQARLNRLSQALAQLNTATTQQAEYATDPTQAENAVLQRSHQLESSFELPPSSLSGYVPPMGPMISQRKVKRAKDKYSEFLKLYGDRAGEAESSLTFHEGEFAGMTAAQVRQMAEMTQPPPAKPVTPNRNLQSKEVLRGGKRAFANFEPDTGKYFDVGSGQEVTDISPVPPASTQGQPGSLPPRTQTRVDQKVKGFEAQAAVKRVQQQAEAVNFANSLDPNTTNPADDQALIYAFAKAMDPDSVVREGEYKTVQTYAQSWAETFGFNVARIFSNTSFLTPQARQNMKSAIQKKYAAGRAQYDNVRKSYAKQIDKITGEPGTGDDWLVDYAGAFPGTDDDAEPKEGTEGVVDGKPAVWKTVNGKKGWYEK